MKNRAELTKNNVQIDFKLGPIITGVNLDTLKVDASSPGGNISARLAKGSPLSPLVSPPPINDAGRIALITHSHPRHRGWIEASKGSTPQEQLNLFLPDGPFGPGSAARIVVSGEYALLRAHATEGTRIDIVLGSNTGKGNFHADITIL